MEEKKNNEKAKSNIRPAGVKNEKELVEMLNEIETKPKKDKSIKKIITPKEEKNKKEDLNNITLEELQKQIKEIQKKEQKIEKLSEESIEDSQQEKQEDFQNKIKKNNKQKSKIEKLSEEVVEENPKTSKTKNKENEPKKEVSKNELKETKLKKKVKKKLKLKNKSVILGFASLIIFVIFAIFLFRFNMISLRYLIPGLIIILLFNMLGIFLLNNKNKVSKILGIILVVMLMITYTGGVYYVNATNSFMNDSFSKEIIYKDEYYIMTNTINEVTKEDIKDNVYYDEQIKNYKGISKYLEKHYPNINLRIAKDAGQMYKAISDNNIKYMIVDRNEFELVMEIDSSVKRENYKVLDHIIISRKEKNDTKVKDIFTMYIGGYDFTGVCTDFNMLVTVNSKTHKVMMTTIPRDYYIPVAGKNGAKDTLSYMGPYGIDISRQSLEDFFKIDIDYYFKVKLQSLKDVVDALGGIEFCSDYNYWTTHALVLNTYDDSKGRRFYVKKGCQHLNGIQTVTVARERMAFPGRDRVRQENCRQILKQIMNKLASPSMLLNYNTVLESFSGLYETNIPKEVISILVKDTLNNPNWEILEQEVGGSDTKDYVHLSNLKDWVMNPDMAAVEKASKAINDLVKEKKK